jgi:uncharacterized protein YfaS (alpha-2-macroglobulin family)
MDRLPRRLWTSTGRIAVLVAMLGALLAGNSRIAPAAAEASTAVVGWSPGVSRAVPLDGPLTLYFNRPMDQAAVVAAWRLEPAALGTFTAGGAAVTFTPSAALQGETTYRLTVLPSARAANGISLAAPFSLTFTTGDALHVRSFSPARGVTGVPVNGLLSITFTHPMVPLAGLDVPAQNPEGWRIGITPALPGHGTWLGTSTWVYRPNSGLRPSTTYTISLAGGVRDTWGDPIAQGLRWSFHTLTPALFSRIPRDGERYVDPRAAITVTFNQSMARSAAKALTVRTAGLAVPGRAVWRGATFVFRPSRALSPTHTYSVSVAPWARSASGPATLGKTVSWHFHVAPLPSLSGTRPGRNGTAFDSGYSPAPSGASLIGNYSATLLFNTPMSKRSLDHHLTITPAVSHLQTYLYGPDQFGDWSYSISGDFTPSAAYTIALSAGVVDAFGRPLGQIVSVPIKTSRLRPSLALYGMPGTAPVISATAGHTIQAPIQFLNLPKVRFTLIRTTLVGIDSVCCSQGQLPPGTTIRTWTATPPDPLNKLQNGAVALTAKDGSPLPPGLYWLDASSVGATPGLPPDASSPQSDEVVVVENTTLTVKNGANGTLVWVTSAKTGKGLAGAAVHLLDYNGRTIVSGTADKSGVWFDRHVRQNVTAAEVNGGGSYGLSELYWSSSSPPTFPFPTVGGGFGPFGYFYYGRTSASTGSTYLYTDRPIYRPGQRVHFRGVLWRDQDAVYSLFGPRRVNIWASDPTGHQLLNTHARLDRYGGVQGSFTLPGNAETGTDNLTIQLPNGPGAYTNFSVADYRKPEFLTTITAAQSTYVQGETARAGVHVGYVFGIPVAHGNVAWTAYAQPLFLQPPGWDSYSFIDWETVGPQLWREQQNQQPNAQFGAQIAQGSGHTDAGGNLRIALPVDLSHQTADRMVTIEATASDASRRAESARVQLTEYQSGLAIGLSAESQVVAAGSPATINIAAVTPDGAALPNTALTARVFRRTYTNKLVDTGRGQSSWEAVPHDTPIVSQTLTSDQHGKATLTFTSAQGGEYRVGVSGKDTHGNPETNAISVDVSTAGSSDWGSTDSTALTLKPDRTTYTVGETAHVLVPAPFDNAAALITVERGTIRRYWTKTLARNSSVVDVPLTLDDLPNIYVTVAVYRSTRNGSPPDWRYGMVELHIRVDPKHLIVHLTQNGYRHHPGDPVTYTVATTDAQGRPVSARLSLALVDTAVLALQDEVNPDILASMYPERGLGVTTGSAATLSIDHLAVQPGFVLQGARAGEGGAQLAAAPAPRAAGAGGGGGRPPGMTVRSNFADTAFWRGDLTTNGAGQATLRVHLPDSATTWRLDARGLTVSQQVGGGTLRTLATQDVILSQVVPRFLVQGDHLQMGAVVHDALKSPVRLRLSLTAAGLSPSHSAPVTVSVPAGGEREVLWSVTAGVVSSAHLLFRAASLTSGVRGDAVALALPAHPPLTDETVAGSGQVYGAIRQMVILPGGAVRQRGALTVRVSASIVAGLGAAFGEFAPQPWESNDDVANRLLAAASLRSLPASVAGLPASMERQLPAIIADAVRKLLGNQLSDGGWPWFNDAWEYSEPTITADVVQALSASGWRGPAVSQAIGRGRLYLLNSLGEVPTASRPHLLLVLAESGPPPARLAAQYFGNSIQRYHLDLAPLADLGFTLGRSHDPRSAATVAATLDAYAAVSATGAHWESNADDFWGEPAIATTTSVLTTLLALSPHDPFVPAAARWLMLARQGDSWDCTHDTAQAIAALAAYARATREGTAAYHYTVVVDGRRQAAGSYGPRNQGQTGVAHVPVAQLHPQTTLTVSRQGTDSAFGRGPLYYVERLHYYLPANLIAPRSEGLSVSRRYLTIAGKPVVGAADGQPIKVELTIHTDQTLLYLHIDDPIPEGCEPIDGSLNTSQRGFFPQPQWWWVPRTGIQDLTPYLIHSDLLDDRVSLNAFYLPPGTYRYTYFARATIPGHFEVPPTHAAEAFFPEVFARSAAQVFTVRQ